MLAGNAAYDPSTFFLIQRTAGTGSSASVTFSSIPSTYSHLQIRGIARDTFATANLQTGYLTFNSDTSSSYPNHGLVGNGTSVTANGSAATTDIASISYSGSAATANSYGAFIIDILDYASTSKYKTVRIFTGFDSNSGTTTNAVVLRSGLWMNTSAISSLTLRTGLTAWTTASTFALYGMKG